MPTFEEFLDLVIKTPDMLLNVEIKDYPAQSGAFAYRSAEFSIGILREAGLLDRCVINSGSGELDEWLDGKCDGELMIHAYAPQEMMGPNQKRFVYDYAYCVCLFSAGQQPVVGKWKFDFAKGYGVESWACFMMRP